MAQWAYIPRIKTFSKRSRDKNQQQTDSMAYVPGPLPTPVLSAPPSIALAGKEDEFP